MEGGRATGVGATARKREHHGCKEADEGDSAETEEDS